MTDADLAARNLQKRGAPGGPAMSTLFRIIDVAVVALIFTALT